MSSGSRYEDLTTLLYLVPFVGAVGYAVFLWIQTGVSATLPTSAYLTVTRDPTLFMVGSLAILLGVMIEVNSTEPAGRSAKLVALGRTLQSIAIASLVIVLLSAWYANGFTDLGGAATDFIVGRYGLVFPAVMVLLSYLLTAGFRLEGLVRRKNLGLIAMILVPATVYLGKHYLVAALVVSLLLIAGGLFLYLAPDKKEQPPKAE